MQSLLGSSSDRSSHLHCNRWTARSSLNLERGLLKHSICDIIIMKNVRAIRSRQHHGGGSSLPPQEGTERVPRTLLRATEAVAPCFIYTKTCELAVFFYALTSAPCNKFIAARLSLRLPLRLASVGARATDAASSARFRFSAVPCNAVPAASADNSPHI